MRERIHFHGVPCTLVAEARVVLPGDESVCVPLRFRRDGALTLDWTDVRRTLDDRALGDSS